MGDSARNFNAWNLLAWNLDCPQALHSVHAHCLERNEKMSANNCMPLGAKNASQPDAPDQFAALKTLHGHIFGRWYLIFFKI